MIEGRFCAETPKVLSYVIYLWSSALMKLRNKPLSDNMLISATLWLCGKVNDSNFSRYYLPLSEVEQPTGWTIRRGTLAKQRRRCELIPREAQVITSNSSDSAPVFVSCRRQLILSAFILPKCFVNVSSVAVGSAPQGGARRAPKCQIRGIIPGDNKLVIMVRWIGSKKSPRKEDTSVPYGNL